MIVGCSEEIVKLLKLNGKPPLTSLKKSKKINEVP